MYIHCSLRRVQPALCCTAFRPFLSFGDGEYRNLHPITGFEAELTIKGKQNSKTHFPLWRVRLTQNTGFELLTHTQKQQVLLILSLSVALVIQHAMRMRHIISSSVACPSVQYFSTLPHKRHNLRDKVTEHKMCVLVFVYNFCRNIPHSKKNSARYYHKCTQPSM